MRWICLFVHHESYLLPSPKHSDHHVCIESGLEKSSMFQWCPTKVRHPSQCPSNVNDEILLQYATVIHRSGMKIYENEVSQVGSAHRIDLYFESEHFLKGSLNWWSQTTLNEIDVWNQMSNSETNETLKSRLLRPFYECQSTLDRIPRPGPSLRVPKLWYYVW